MTVAIAESRHYQQMDAVANLHMQGYNLSQIAKELKLPRKDAVKLLDEWKETLISDTAARDRAHDALNKLDVHYDSLIKKAYNALDEIQLSIDEHVTPQNIQQKGNLLKLIADLEAKRLDALQRSGLLDAQDMGNEMAKIQDKQDKLVGILKHDLCNVCKPVVLRKLQDITGRVEAVVVYSD